MEDIEKKKTVCFKWELLKKLSLLEDYHKRYHSNISLINELRKDNQILLNKIIFLENIVNLN
jgi:hypothetical protein